MLALGLRVRMRQESGQLGSMVAHACNHSQEAEAGVLLRDQGQSMLHGQAKGLQACTTMAGNLLAPEGKRAHLNLLLALRLKTLS